MTRVRAGAAAAGVLLAIAALASSASGTIPVGTRTVEITIRHSRFSMSRIEVRRGERVRFVVHNRDPIDHELIVGDLPAQLRHETGTEREHGARDGEISVPLFESATTSYTFDEPGTLMFGCHLPGHWTYGMQGTIKVNSR
jgi:uncharacterized cupredoxin-like copper-binding protein